MMRQDWIDMKDDLATTRQCELAGVSRATTYARQKPKVADEDDLLLCRLIDEEYTRHPFYGTRRMVIVISKAVGYRVNRKRLQRLMRQMGLQGMAPGPNTSRAHPQHPIYPYLLRGLEITRPNQVWSTDITYIRLANGFVYLVAVMDWYSRKVLSWRISCQHGCQLLRGMPGRGAAQLWHARDIQQRPRLTVHQCRLHGSTPTRRDQNQHGRTWSGL